MGVEIQLFECYAKKSYKRYERKTNDLLITFIGNVNDLNKLQQFKSKCSKIPLSTSVHFSTVFGNSTCSSPEVVLAFLLYLGSTVHNGSDQFVSCVYFSLQTSLFIHPHRQKSDLYAPTSNSCIFTPIENWTHVYMNLFNSE